MAELAILLVVIAGVWTIYVQAIVMAVRRPDYAYRAIGRTKAGTVVMIVLTGFIGGLFFLLRIRPALRAAERSIPPESVPPADTGDIKRWRQTQDPWS